MLFNFDSECFLEDNSLQNHTGFLYVNMGYNKAYDTFWDWKCQTQALSEHARGGRMETEASCYKATKQHFFVLYLFSRINGYRFDEFFG